MAAMQKAKATCRQVLIGVVAGSGIMYRVNTTNDALVMGVSGRYHGKLKYSRRICPWMMKAASHANTSTSRPVAMPWTISPVKMMNSGSAQCQKPVRFSVKWYGGARPTHGKQISVTTMPKLDGLKTWCIRPSGIGTRKITFEQIDRAEAK